MSKRTFEVEVSEAIEEPIRRAAGLVTVGRGIVHLDGEERRIARTEIVRVCSPARNSGRLKNRVRNVSGDGDYWGSGDQRWYPSSSEPNL